MAKSQRDSAPEHRGRSFSTTSDTAMESFRADYQQMSREKGDLEKEKQELLKKVKNLEYEKVCDFFVHPSVCVCHHNAEFSFFLLFSFSNLLIERSR